MYFNDHLHFEWRQRTNLGKQTEVANNQITSFLQQLHKIIRDYSFGVWNKVKARMRKMITVKYSYISH